MIFNDLERLGEFCRLEKPYLEAILDFISTCSKDIENGTYPIDGEALYANVNSYNAAPGKTNEFESHQKYVDLQILLSGEEQIFLSDVALLQPSQTYDINKDFALWMGTEQTSLLLIPGKFALFFPQDAHQVGRSASGNSTPCKKVVFKIACDLFH